MRYALAPTAHFSTTLFSLEKPVCEDKTLQWKIVALKVEAKDRLTEINFGSRGSPWGLAYLRALGSSAIKGDSQQHHVHPNISLTSGDSRPPLISFLSPEEPAVVRLLCWMDAVLQPPAAGLQNTYDAYSSLAGSMVPLLHINIKCQAWNSYVVFPTPPYKQNTSFSSQLMFVP